MQPPQPKLQQDNVHTVNYTMHCALAGMADDEMLKRAAVVAVAGVPAPQRMGHLEGGPPVLADVTPRVPLVTGTDPPPVSHPLRPETGHPVLANTGVAQNPDQDPEALDRDSQGGGKRRKAAEGRDEERNGTGSGDGTGACLDRGPGRAGAGRGEAGADHDPGVNDRVRVFLVM